MRRSRPDINVDSLERHMRLVHLVIDASGKTILGVYLTGDEAYVQAGRIEGATDQQAWLTSVEPDDGF